MFMVTLEKFLKEQTKVTYKDGELTDDGQFTHTDDVNKAKVMIGE